MNKFTQHLNFTHDKANKVGIVLANLGTPEAPTSGAIRKYLREFLSDPRVIEIPKPIWQIILNAFILPFRPRKLKHNYADIWTEQGAPLLANSLSLRDKLIEKFKSTYQHSNIEFAFGFRYGQPSLHSALEELYEKNCQHIFVLPMYPQYSATTTGSTFDSIADFMKRERFVPNLRFLNHYCDDPHYIQAVASQIKEYIQTHGAPNRFVFSFHGLPKRNLSLGDPYHCQCHKTGRLIAEAAGLTEQQWQVTFQSRFGKAEWLQPYTDKTMQSLGESGVNHIAVLCPGFPIDCLETLEEIQVENKTIFMEAGGKRFDYIPCLNDSSTHVDALSEIIMQNIKDWLHPNLSCPQLLQARKKRADTLGAA